MEHEIKAGSSSAVIDSRGAQLLSLRDGRDIEYVWQRDPAYWAKSAPTLFPIVGRLRGGKTVIEGETFAMDCHGFAAASTFEVCESAENSVFFLLKSSEETHRSYPYDFELRVGFTLSDGGLTVSYSVNNTDHRPILFGIGGHPAFNCPLAEGEAFEDYELEFEAPESLASPGFEEGIICYHQARDVMGGRKILPLTYDIFVPDAIILDGLRSRKISLRSRKSGRGLRFEFADFSTVAFWTPPHKHAPFICFEPWFGMGARDDEKSGDFADKKGLVRLPEGETFSAAYSMFYL